MIREFNSLENSDPYVWHRDLEDRTIEVLFSDGEWYFQEDNHLPVLLFPMCTIDIKKMVFHRLIPGSGKLKLKITKHLNK
ncbi:MAG: hypothetical protein ACR2L5_01490 [Candidatus Actinomarinaceae bacterium]